MAQSKIYLYNLFLLVMSQAMYNNNTLLIIISFDGFRYDYFERNLTNTLISLKVNSSYAPYMTSVFPTKTFTNHFSIATGLYTEVHGVLDNKVYDKIADKTLSYGYELFHYNKDIVPLWILNEKGGAGRHSGCMMWPGCNFKYQDMYASHFVEFNMSVTWEDRVDMVLGWFKHPETPINLGMMYFEQPDATCHEYGPDSEQVNREIARVDQIVHYLLKAFGGEGLLQRLNIVFLSDHGGQSILVPQHIINLDDYVNKSWYIKEGVPPNLQIYPVKGKEAEVLEALRNARISHGSNFTTYIRDEIPERWHYKDCTRAPPILLAADLGYLFHEDSNYTNKFATIGQHGYDPEDPTMRAFFMAMGPLFKHNYTTQPFSNIHIYPLAAHMLDLTLPELRPNGSLAQLQDILVNSAEEERGAAYLVAGLSCAIIFTLVMISWFAFQRYRRYQEKLPKSSSASYKVLTQTTDEERGFDGRETVSSDPDDESPT